MTVFLSVLKITGIVLAAILLLLILIILLLLFWPFGIRLRAGKKESLKADVLLHYFFHALRIRAVYEDGLKITARVFGIKVYEKPGKKGKEKPEDGPEDELHEKFEDEPHEKPEDEPSDLSVPEDIKESFPENDVSQEERSGKKASLGNRKKKRPLKARIRDLIKKCEKAADKLEDTLTDIPFTVDEFEDKAEKKFEEAFNTIEYYDRILNSKGADESLTKLKKRLKGALKPLRPKRTDIYFYLSSDDPEKVAKVWEAAGMLLPLLDEIKARADIDAGQGDDDIKGELFMRFSFPLFPIVWNALLIITDKKLKKFIKLLKREET